MRLGAALAEAHDAEARLVRALARASERHPGEHDVVHVARVLRRWAEAHVAALAAQAERLGVYAGPRGEDAPTSGVGPEPATPLLGDLRDLYLAAARASLAWTVLGQGAQALDDRDLLEVVTRCHPETIRTMAWAVQKAKEASPQALAS